MFDILAISGSLRQKSSNTALLRAAKALAPENVTIEILETLGALPHFNPDLEGHEPPVVKAFFEKVGAADGILISSPEYAHGIPGVLKNALDWLVGGFEFIDKPIALFNASPYSTHGQAALTEVITVMTGRIIASASIELPLRGKNLDEHGIAAIPEFATPIRQALYNFAGEIRAFNS